VYTIERSHGGSIRVGERERERDRGTVRHARRIVLEGRRDVHARADRHELVARAPVPIGEMERARDRAAPHTRNCDIVGVAAGPRASSSAQPSEARRLLQRRRRLHDHQRRAARRPAAQLRVLPWLHAKGRERDLVQIVPIVVQHAARADVPSDRLRDAERERRVQKPPLRGRDAEALKARGGLRDFFVE
jgi:hypothetical protein